MDPPPVRASDAERDAAVGALQRAAGEGRLSLDELSERVGRALTAPDRAELERLTADLPAAPAATAPRGRRWVVGIMGGGDQRGRWRLAPRCTVVNVMGGADLDLTSAIVEAPQTEIRVYSLMGGSDITVPPGVHVELSSFALMGGDELKVEGERPPLGAPVIRVRTVSIMGGTDVRSPRRARG